MSALSELLQEANREGLSVAAIADKARSRGHEIGHDTVWKYMSGRHGKVSERYLVALADVLPVKVDELRAAAQVPANLGEYTPPPEANALSRQERAAIDLIIRSMASGKSAVVVKFPHHGTSRDLDDYDVEAAHESPEPAGLPEPESP